MSYYRIRHIGKNGKHSKLIFADFSRTKVLVYPNPAKYEFRIQSKEAIMNVRIMSDDKQLIQYFIPNAGNQYNISGLQPGFYFVEVGTKDGTETLQLQIEQ